MRKLNLKLFVAGREDDDCQDKNKKCSSLARNGDCLKNAAYMLEKCRKSCFMCGGRKAGKLKSEDVYVKIHLAVLVLPLIIIFFFFGGGGW